MIITPSTSSAVETVRAVPQLNSGNRVAYGQSFHDVPASYVKKIQSGKFFELSTLLLKNLFHTNDDQPVTLTVDNSTIKIKSSTPSCTSITEIEQWTTAFTFYMSVFAHEFLNRVQELLQYMTIICHAAHCHKGVGWCIYDIMFRRKAALDKSLDWSVIDQELWLMIFTVPPASLREEFPLFNNRPQMHVSPGAERGGIYRDFNRTGASRRNPCQYRHICNRCKGKTLELSAQPMIDLPGQSQPEHSNKEKTHHSSSSPTQNNHDKVNQPLQTPNIVSKLEQLLVGQPDQMLVSQLCMNLICTNLRYANTPFKQKLAYCSD